MLLAGLTGGLASGKSFVGRALVDLGCHLIQADELGHQVLLPHGDAYAAAVQEFGPDILNEDSTIDRRKLGVLVFGDPQKLAKLSAIVHPAVAKRQKEIIRQITETEPNAIIVVEAAILVETGSYRNFDRLIVVVCTWEQQVQRAMRRDSLTREEVEARLSRQLPLEEKKRVAHYVIDTSGAKEQTLEQTRKLYLSLRSLQS